MGANYPGSRHRRSPLTVASYREYGLIAPTDPLAPLLLYFDTDNRLQVGTWGAEVTKDNILFTQFGSVVAFTLTGPDDSWGSGDIKFNPTTAVATATATLEASTGWTGWLAVPHNTTSTTTDGFVSSSSYHTPANVLLGKGDICKLVGYTAEGVKASTVRDNGKYRLPTYDESNLSRSGEAGSSPMVMTFTNGMQLPAVGRRESTDGSNRDWGSVGYWWTSRPNGASGRYLLFSAGSAGLTIGHVARNGFPIRCVRDE